MCAQCAKIKIEMCLRAPHTTRRTARSMTILSLALAAADELANALLQKRLEEIFEISQCAKSESLFCGGGWAMSRCLDASTRRSTRRSNACVGEPGAPLLEVLELEFHVTFVVDTDAPVAKLDLSHTSKQVQCWINRPVGQSMVD